MLTYLDLSASVFSGRVPPEVSHLVKLFFLKLSTDSFGGGLLKLDGSDFTSLVQNLTQLEYLRLRYVSISSSIPYSMANLSSLKTLDVHRCELFGEFPIKIFHFQNIRDIYLRDNQDLTGYLPVFNQSSRIRTIDVHNTLFSGIFPSSINNIATLEQLDVAACNFSEGLVPSSIGYLKELSYLDISKNQFIGPIPESFANLTKLRVFRIATSRVNGSLPSWIGNFSMLVHLDLSFCWLSGLFSPSLFSNLTSLEIIYLHANQLEGRVKFQKFQNLHRLTHFDLSDNLIDFQTDTVVMNSTVPQFIVLGLGECNLTLFPYFLRYQKKMEILYLYNNKIQGHVPTWMWNMSVDSLKYLYLHRNLLSGFEKLPDVLPWVNLKYLSLSSNMFSGPLPIPGTSTLGYEAQDNNFIGEIPHGICNMSSLMALVMSNNNLSGMIPRCLGNFSDNLSLLLLKNNTLSGTLPETYTNKSKLRMLDASQNQLIGQLPRSLANCQMLETLVLSSNNLSDSFPFWLATLPQLKILALRHNNFNGMLSKPKNSQRFPQLRLLDMSYNNFVGHFRAKDIFSEFAMRPNISDDFMSYIEVAVTYTSDIMRLPSIYYGSTLTITSKGVDRYYARIQKALAVIDISCNKFEGGIDEWIGNLKGLHFLNVSNNLFTGTIPSSLGSLVELESLDLSNNKLTGTIPNELGKLTFIAEFNVSYNKLVGRIPSGTQLRGFDVTSYEGNPGLCGDPLPKKCGSYYVGDQVPSEESSSDSEVTFHYWIFVIAGYVSGVVIGVVLADVAIKRRPSLYLKIVSQLTRLMKKT